MSIGLSPATLKAYKSTWSLFTLFCLSLNIPIYPVLISTVCAFIVHNFQTRNVTIPTIRRMLAGVQFNARCYDPSFSSLFSNSAIRLLLKGLTKTYKRTPDKRLPITPDILQKLISALREGMFSNYINNLLEAVFLMAFYGFMRPGEFFCNTQSFDHKHDLAYSGISFSPTHYNIFLKHSKSDPMRKGVTITITKLNGSLCPFDSMVRFLTSHPHTSAAPLFILPNGLPMTKHWFREHLSRVLKKCSLSPSLYTGHSFRIGAATTAAKIGLPISSIKALGRWTSASYKSYIRPDNHLVRDAQMSLSKAI
ncbi:hypothetical protein AMEX_G24742 [Astyanax mexicanus]|uniref:Tyr recombinase domain-containing protein n=1 Tax=Astyanax mexicanus TaxID=7994 RepID=A0A8T2KTB8_ASTMX|nr:hypothetical protein AMEX_G24742 [Astyanax mexicanus]